MAEQRLTRRQAAIIGCATGILVGPFEDVQILASELMGHPLWTHDLGNKDVYDRIKAKAKPLLLSICAAEEPEGST